MKQIRNIQTWLIILALVLTLGVLFGGQAIATKIKVDDPLRREIKSISGVKNYEITQEKDGIKINLSLAKVNNLQNVLDPVKQKVEFLYNKPVKEITIKDNSNQLLKEVRYQLSFNLEEAVVSGRYIQLKTALESYSDLKLKVYFNRAFIYIQLEDGDKYHYEAFPRQSVLMNLVNGGDTI